MTLTLRRALLSLTLCALLLTGIKAQPPFGTTAREAIDCDPRLSASNFTAYREPAAPLTPTPQGYEPFYLSHYGRHGSRWLINKSDYTDALGVLQRAHEAGQLTERGEQLLTQIVGRYEEARHRLGELTTVGEAQHHRIGKRMAQRFPEIFLDEHTQIDARATTVIRCILSMTAACEELAAANPRANIHNDVSQTFQYYLNADWSERANRDNEQRWQAVTLPFEQDYLNPERFWSVVVKDTAYRDKQTPSRRQVMRSVFRVCSNQQSHEPYVPLYDLFTNDEIYDLWRCSNIEWYVGNAHGAAPVAQAELLRNIIATADTIADSDTFHGATLRYGHEVCLLPLATLMELGGTRSDIDAQGLDTLDRAWANFRIFPMGCNIQLVFYRPSNGEGDVLVKALLNEEETSLPAQPVSGPYYRWSDLRDYYLRKLQDYEEAGQSQEQ